MLFFRKKKQGDLRDLAPVTKRPPPPTIDRLQSDAFYADVHAYFRDYPPRSLMSDHSRAVLFSLIRILRPTYIAEIGTFHAGTTEAMARAAWENNWGIIYTADPFGAERCPAIIGQWPEDLRKYVSFHPLSSMDFLSYLVQRRISLDFTLVDGNHDYEYALFDLLKAARMTRPSGLIVMDNAEQSGPFTAVRSFLAANPLWRELGSAVADHDPSNPFDASRASLPGTSFVILQAPAHLVVGDVPCSWGQAETDSARMAGLVFALPDQTTAGTLHYQVIFRSFKEGDEPIEAKRIGRVRIGLPAGATLTHAFDDVLELPAGEKYTVEIDMAWQADAGAPPLELISVPAPLAG
jgi:predicted O-methyltransferase YrrM